MRAAIRRWHTVPFEALFGWLVLFSGLFGLFHIGTTTDALDAVLGHGLLAFFQTCYAVAGLLMLLGLARAKAWIEGPGIVLLVMGAVARLGAILILYGFDSNVAVAIVFYMLLTYYAVIRLIHLWHGDVILRVNPKDGLGELQ